MDGGQTVDRVVQSAAKWILGATTDEIAAFDFGSMLSALSPEEDGVIELEETGPPADVHVPGVSIHYVDPFFGYRFRSVMYIFVVYCAMALVN